MSWDEPTQAEFDDAIIEDTVHCARCGAPHVLPEGHLSGDRSICEECTDDEIADLIRQRDEGKSRAEEDARRGRYSIDPLHARALEQVERLKADHDRLTADVEDRDDAIDCLQQIGEIIGCGHVDGRDDRARLVRCVREEFERLRGEVNPPPPPATRPAG